MRQLRLILVHLLLISHHVQNDFSQGPTEAERKIEELTRQLEEEMEKQEEEGEYFGKQRLLAQRLFGHFVTSRNQAYRCFVFLRSNDNSERKQLLRICDNFVDGLTLSISLSFLLRCSYLLPLGRRGLEKHSSRFTVDPK